MSILLHLSVISFGFMRESNCSSGDDDEALLGVYVDEQQFYATALVACASVFAIAVQRVSSRGGNDLRNGSGRVVKGFLKSPPFVSICQGLVFGSIYNLMP